MNQASSPTPLAEQIAAAQAWWREAGVDFVFHDEPRAWLADDAPPAHSAAAVTAPASPVEPPRARIGGDPSGWPQDLAAFHRWWLEDPSLDTGGAALRVAPRGEAGAALMILVPMPEAEDSDTLLSERHGTLVGNMLRAMNIPPERAYLAAALPRHASHPDWAGLAARGLGAWR